MLLLLEGFDCYGTLGRSDTGLDTDVEKRHEGGSILFGSPDGDLIAGRGGDSTGLRFNYHSSNRIVVTRYNPEATTLIIGFAFKTPTEFGVAAVGHYMCELAPSFLRVYWGNGSLHLHNSDWTPAYKYIGQGLQANRWYYLEFKIYFHATLGTVEVRINGQTTFSETNLDTQYLTYEHGLLNLYAPDVNCAFDDLYICDETGSYNNDFLGPIKVETLRPTSDDGAQNWTPSAGGDHSALVDNANMWDQADYIEATGANIDDLWVYSDISTITGAIQGVQLITSAWTDIGVPLVLQSICESGNTTDYSPSKGIGADTLSATQEMIWETDPDTANAWTANGIDGASFGVRKI